MSIDQGNLAGGLTVLDWNRDGDSDLYLGREISTQSFFYRTETDDGDDSLNRDFVCVRLSSPQSVNNRSGIGAEISIDVAGTRYYQWVDGGSGRGSQDDLAVTFPVSLSSGTYSVQVKWPNGWVQVHDAQVNRVDQDPETVVDNTDPTVVDATVKGSTAYDPVYDQFFWVFNWETDHRSDWSLDSVTVPVSSCVYQQHTYTAGSAGVDATISRLANGRYRHVLKVQVDCNSPCVIPFTVSSTHRVGITSTSTEKTLKVKFCPSGL